MREHRVERYSGPLGAWEHATAWPDARLRGLVTEYQGYAETRSSFPARRELPSADVVMILTFSGRERVVDPREPESPSSWGSMVTGIWDTFALSSLDPGWRGMQVNFPPLGAFAFFGQPLGPISNRVVALEDLLGRREASELLDRLEEADGWGPRFRILDDLFLSRSATNPPPCATVRSAWNRIAAARGDVRVMELAEEVGCSRNHLWTRFREEVGVSPKLLCRILRFQRAVELMTNEESGPLGRVALTCGYFDQSHLVRDFRQFAGFSPTEFLRHRLPDPGGVRDE